MGIIGAALLFMLMWMVPSVLRPGGQIELVEIDWEPLSDRPPPNPCHYREWFDQTAKAARERGKPIVGVFEAMRRSLDGGDFSITCTKREKLDLEEDCLLERMELRNLLARRHRELLYDPALGHLEGLSMRLLTQKGWTPAQVRALCNAARKELFEEKFLPYHIL